MTTSYLQRYDAAPKPRNIHSSIAGCRRSRCPFYDNPDEFIHFGFGSHECLGRYIGMVMIPEMIRQVLLRTNIAASAPINEGAAGGGGPGDSGPPRRASDRRPADPLPWPREWLFQHRGSTGIYFVLATSYRRGTVRLDRPASQHPVAVKRPLDNAPLACTARPEAPAHGGDA